MRIGVVAAEMERQRTGVGRYLAGLLHGIRALDPGWEWILFFQGRRFDHPLWSSGAVTPVFCERGGSPVLWEQLWLPRFLARHALDLVHSPAYSLPPRLPAPGVVTIHDLSFEVLPEEFGWRERWRRRLLARHAAGRAARVLTDTERVAGELGARYRIGRDRLGVVPLALDPVFLAPPAAPAVQAASALEELGVRPPYLLQVGTVLERRCPELVLEAFSELARERPGLSLVLAGANRLRRPLRLAETVARLGLEGRVTVLGYVADSVLPELYRRAELSLYVSRYEGFGLPPLESLACATPVVVSAGLALDEIWPDYPLRCASLERDELVRVIRRGLADGPLRAGIVGHASELCAGRSWRDSAGLFLRQLEMAAAR